MRVEAVPDSCATYHSVFLDWYIDNVHQVDTILKGSCNAGVTTSTTKGLFCVFEVWLNRGGIMNLLSIPQLEEDGFRVRYDTNGDWIVTSPSGEDIVFKSIGMRKNHARLTLLQTVRKNFEGFTKKQVEKALLARNVQAMVGHPSDGEFNQMVSFPSINTVPLTLLVSLILLPFFVQIVQI